VPVKKSSTTLGSAPPIASRPAATTVALVLIEDNRLLRQGIAALIRSEPGFEILASSADVEVALLTVREARPDVVLLDLGLPDHDSLSLTGAVRAEVPEARVIVMGLPPDREDIADFVRAGASGFIMKNATLDEFFATIRAVAAGAEVLPRELTRVVFTQIAQDSGRDTPDGTDAVLLTNREREVVGLLGEGLSNKAIADRLHIAVQTVKTHVHNVLEKLSLRSRLEIAVFSHSHGITAGTPDRNNRDVFPGSFPAGAENGASLRYRGRQAAYNGRGNRSAVSRWPADGSPQAHDKLLRSRPAPQQTPLRAEHRLRAVSGSWSARRTEPS
jgi:DNA-binding NarL/FixJ family response regulator